MLAPAGMPAAGRWLLCHSGTVDARCFGVFGPDVPADDALDALMADGSVTRIDVYKRQKKRRPQRSGTAVRGAKAGAGTRQGGAHSSGGATNASRCV